MLPSHLNAVCSTVIRSFGDKRAQALFGDEFVAEFQGVARRAKRKLEAIHAANKLADQDIPAANRLEQAENGT